MKIKKNLLMFESNNSGVNCFFSDIFKLSTRRNLLFFIKQLLKGIKLELYYGE